MRAWWWMLGSTALVAPGAAWAQQAPIAAPTSQAAPALAQAAPADAADDPDADDADTPDIVVTGRRTEPGAVIGDIKPEVQLGPADIRSYGVSSISDLLDELAPQTTSGRGGRPVILVNGHRISSFAEIRDLPTEAVLRVDILPEEVALKYGYSAEQKVVNFVLRQRFRSQTLEAIAGTSTDGGGFAPRGKLGILTIKPDSRFSLNLDYQQQARLLESQRDIISTAQSGAFDVFGNITPANGAVTIDPALDALAGAPVTIAGVPASAANGPTALTGFAANQPNTTDLSPYRTLLPATRDFTMNAVYARTFGKVQATVNGSLELASSTADQGLPGYSVLLPAGNPFSPFGSDVTLNRFDAALNPLHQASQTNTAHLGFTLNGDGSRWRWSLTGNYDRIDASTFTQTGADAAALQAALLAGDPTVNPFGTINPLLIGETPANRATSTSNVAGVDGLVTGNLFSLPAGAVTTSIRVGGSTSDFTSQSTRMLVEQRGKVTRQIVDGQVNLDVPISDRGKDVLAAIGDLSANANFAVHHLSDFGTLTTRGYGLHWRPIDPVNLLVSRSDQDDAPTAQQLGNPTIITPNARTFDYVTGQTVDVSRITGGNPNLLADTQHVFKAELNVRPLKKAQLNLTATYVDTRTENAIADFPSATAAIEAAFPDRFTRDASGTLTSVDARPVNLSSEHTKLLRWGFNFSQPLKSKLQKQIEAFRAGTGPNPFAGLRRPGGDGGPPNGGPGGPPGAGSGGPGGFRGGGGRFGGGRFGGGRGGFAGGRLQFAVYHSWYFEDRAQIRPGLPVLDLLDGATLGSGGGQSRHQVEVQAGYVNNGLGARLSANWQSATRVVGGTLADPQTLNFGSLTTVNFRLFADFASRLDFIVKHPWARGLRVTLSAENLFNSRQRVTDQTGETPISYQPDYLDPLGRTVRISIRKLFYQRSAR